MIFENIKLAFLGLSVNKVRTFLTMLGIIIGIAAIITIMTISDAMRTSVMSSMGDMGADEVEVYVEEKEDENEGEEEIEVRDMKDKDYMSDDMLRDIKRHFSDTVKDISLNSDMGESKVKLNGRYANISLSGVNTGYLKENNIKILAGRNLKKKDMNGRLKTAIVSDRFVDNIVGGDVNRVLGQTYDFTINDQYYEFTVVGVYKYVQSSESVVAGTGRKNIKTKMYIPITTSFREEHKDPLYDDINVVTRTGSDPVEFSSEIEDYLNKKYYRDNDAYNISSYSMQQEVDEMNNMLNTLKIAMIAIGAISLFVGGIGVMNIMIVSITERTREIGIRKALGATNGDIRLQFITESIVVCLTGGMIGIALGSGAGMAASHIMKYSGSVSLKNIIICLVFSIIFGVSFGYYPADKAARQNPADALRYE